jgi:hypothetical protein
MIHSMADFGTNTLEFMIVEQLPQPEVDSRFESG